MGANGIIQVNLVGTFTTTALAATFIVRVKFGGVTIYADTSPSIVLSATTRGLGMFFILCNRSNIASQTGGGNLNLSDAGAVTTGVGNFGATDLGNATISFAASAVDTALAQTFEITVQHSSASAGITTVRELACTTLSPTA